MKKAIKFLLQRMGLEVNRASAIAAPGSTGRAVGRMDYLLEDLRARGLKCNTILDVGAHKGEWSRLAKTIFPDATVCLVEPQREMKVFLESFCRDFPGSVHFLGGAGAKPEVRTLTIWPDLMGSSFLPPSDPSRLHNQENRGT